MMKQSILNTYITLNDRKKFNNEKMYRDLAEQSPVGLLVCDVTGKIQYVNKRVVDLMGSPSIKETLKINLFTFPKLVEIGASDKIRSCIEESSDKIFDVHYVSKWGNDLWLKINAVPIVVDNHVEGARIVIDDMTDFMHQQQLVKENEQHFKVMFEHLGDAIWVVNRDGIINYVNEKACKDSGYTEEELVGLGIHKLDPDLSEGEFATSFDYIMKEGYLHHIGKSTRKSGDLIDIEIHAVCLDFDNKPLVVCSIRNITERLNKEQELLIEKEKADAANKAKSNFLSNMSHEIRTPINGMMGFLQMLKSTSLDEEQLDYLQWMKSSADSLLRVIDVLDMSKIETGKLKIQKQSFSIKTLIDECVSVVEFKAEKKNVKLYKNYMDLMPKDVNGDSFRIQQVVINLLDNAIKFTEQGHVKIDIGLKTDNMEDGMLYIIVEDSGIGIEKNQLERLFKPFEQYDLSLIRKYGGTGLGLTICKALVELMEGTITVESQLGLGTRIQVEIPLEIVARESTDSNLDDFSDQKECIPNDLKVLVVDDCPVNRMLLTKMLENDGVDYQCVENGEEALELLKKYPFDLVFLDCQLPGIDGYEVAKRIRNQETLSNKDLRIIATTAFATEEDQKKCLDAGMNTYLSKPLDLEIVKSFYREK